ncbi:MAG: serine/threonine protein kinase, partial [Polyangiaceae bacterium]|nr:serine/threonine protein kinase [Polyangiaceae bacterium]
MECPVCQQPNVDGARFCAKCGALLPSMVQKQDDPLIGQVIKNTFRVVRLLGEGGMGRVYEGEQQMGNITRKVAIKTLHPHLSQDPQIVARFNRECGTVAELEHPNTIQFFDFGQTPDGTLFVAMEFLDGESVCALIERDGPMSPKRVENIMRQVCGSLCEAHKKGVVHRDLKPDNVVLTTRAGEADFVKVLDFGIAARTEAADAKKEQKLTQQGMVLGTPPYMSPEQFTGKELDGRSDIYSLGVMAYEMLTGKLPFDAETPWEWATKHLTGRPYPFELTAPRATMSPAGMKAAIMRALSKTPQDRQPNVTAFFEDLTTVDAPVALAATALAAAPGTGTAAMAAPPAELLRGAGGPAPRPRPTANEMVVPVQQAYAAPPRPVPPPKAPGAGGKLLVAGLAGLVGLAGIVVVVLVARGMSSSTGDDERLELGSALPTPAGVAEISPLASSETANPAPSVSATDASTAPATTNPPSIS